MKYTIIGGVNGVGKSTIYSSQSDADVKALGKRINVDEIVSTYGDWRDTHIQFCAGKKAVAEIKSCLQERIDFHQETTLSGQTVLHTAKEAKAMGYTVHLWYIFVSDVEIAKQRVRARVASGGHGISDEIIERRSITSLKTLKVFIPLCDEVWLYDNTVTYNLVAHISGGAVTLLDKNIPSHISFCLE
ncbi:MAG: ATPase [Defluviitaleaceae bacterium]|nr:ATPase [Defluviitaleaceae bacterium]